MAIDMQSDQPHSAFQSRWEELIELMSDAGMAEGYLHPQKLRNI